MNMYINSNTYIWLTTHSNCGQTTDSLMQASKALIIPPSPCFPSQNMAGLHKPRHNSANPVPMLNYTVINSITFYITSYLLCNLLISYII